MTEQTVTRFDLDFLDTEAVRALAEAEPALLASIARRKQNAHAAAMAMTVAELKQRIGSAAKGGKEELATAYAKMIASGGLSAKELADLTAGANMDRNLAYTLNRMMKQADDARAAMERLHEEHPQDRMRKLRNHLIALHVGEHAARVLRAVINDDVDLREAVQGEFTAAVQAVLRYADAILEGTSSFLTEEQVAAANDFRRNMGGVMPATDVPARRLV